MRSWIGGEKHKMTSYASIDRIEENYAVCEVEMMELEESRKTDFGTRDTIMVDIPVHKILEVIGREPEEGDIIVVEHEGETINLICYEDVNEKTRRIQQIIAIMQN